MLRVKPGGYSELIEAAYAVIPEPMHALIRPDFLCGVDPVFAGLHDWRAAADGRPYSETWHVAYELHQTTIPRDRRRTTVVLQDVIDDAPWTRRRCGHAHPVAMVVHELGHVLHESLNWEPNPTPVTAYAHTNRFEAFADAFTAWLIPSYTASYGSTTRVDDATESLFAELASDRQA